MADNTIRYTADWNRTTRQPVAGEWIDESAARKLYETFSGLDVVDAATIGADGLPVQRWALGIGTSGRIRASFFGPHNTLWREVDWDWIDGRLWRWITVDYTYPDNTQPWRIDQWIRKQEAAVAPDGTGDLLTIDKSGTPSSGRREVDFDDRAFDKYWLDRPEFGNWYDLANPGPSALEVAGLDDALESA